MKNDLKIVIILTFIFIVDVLGIVLGFILDLDILILLCLSLLFVVTPLLIYFTIPVIKNYTINNQVNKRKCLEDNYSKLYVVSSNKTKTYNFIKEIKSKRLSLSNIDFKLKVNKICFTYNYLGFNIYIDIHEDFIKCKIFTSLKYRKGIKNVKIFQTKKRIRNEDLTIDGICDIARNLNLLVDDYRNDNIVDDYYNGRLFNKFNNCKEFLKNKGIAYIALGLISLYTNIILTITLFNSPIEDVVGVFAFIVYIIFWIIGFISTKVGISKVIIYKNLLKDFKEKETFEIKGKPYKVKFIIDGPSRGSGLYTVEFVKLYFDKCNVLILIPYMFVINSKSKVKKCIYELKDMNCNFSVFKNSKIIVTGESKLISFIYKYLKKQ